MARESFKNFIAFSPLNVTLHPIGIPNRIPKSLLVDFDKVRTGLDPLNFLRTKITKKEIINDFQLKLESNFMMYFNENDCPSDIFFSIDELFLMKTEVDKFIFTVKGISARLHQ